MFCPVIQLNNQKTGLKVTATPAANTIVSVANGANQKGGVTTAFAGGLYDLATAMSSLETAEWAFAVVGINPMATRSLLVEGSPVGTTTVTSLTVVSYDPSTGVIQVSTDLEDVQELVGLYVEDENGTTYEITENDLAASPDTITIIGGPEDSPVDSENPFFAGKSISILGQALDVVVGGHKYNVHGLTVATKSPGDGYAYKTDIDGNAHAYKSTIEVAEALISDEIGIDLTTVMYVHWRGGVHEVTNVEYGSPFVKIEIKNGPTQMEDGEEFWVAPYAVAPEYAVEPAAPAKLPCVPDNFVPLAAVLMSEAVSPNVVLEADIYDLREDFNLLSDNAVVDLGAKDVVIAGDTANVILAQIYVSTAAPTVTNDSQDSAGLGTTFQVGAMWLQTGGTPALFVCADSTPNAADWQQIL